MSRTKSYLKQRGIDPRSGIRKPTKGAKPGKSKAKGFSTFLTPKQRRRAGKKGMWS